MLSFRMGLEIFEHDSAPSTCSRSTLFQRFGQNPRSWQWQKHMTTHAPPTPTEMHIYCRHIMEYLGNI
jgi:hypothetical protein